MQAQSTRVDLVVSNSTAVLAQLRLIGLRRLDLSTRIACSGEELFEELERAVPDAVILEHLPRVAQNALTLCTMIKGRPGLGQVPVIIVGSRDDGEGLRARARQAGCDEIVEKPLYYGQLHDVLCEHLSIPRRRHRRVKIEIAASTFDTGAVLRDLSVGGALVRLPRNVPCSPGQRTRIELSSAPGVELDAVVVRRRDICGETEIALAFSQLPAQVMRHLENLTTWRIERSSDHVTIHVLRGLDESCDFSELPPLVGQRVVFNLFALDYLNSVGVGRWIDLLRRLPLEVNYDLEGCTVAFCVAAGYIPSILGRGRVRSFLASYECFPCRHEHELLMRPEQISGVQEPPSVPCSVCGASMVFAELPERYFSFLKG